MNFNLLCYYTGISFKVVVGTIYCSRCTLDCSAGGNTIFYRRDPKLSFNFYKYLCNHCFNEENDEEVKKWINIIKDKRDFSIDADF
jgi:hypothetical protein